MRVFGLLVLFLSVDAIAEEWKPPEMPDPQVILNEAREDMRAKRYEIALAKHVWFHEKALQHRPSFAGVRLSFALSDWHSLGQLYPPALTKLEEVRDQAAKDVIAGKRVRDCFHDMSAINRTLGKDTLTKETFEALDSKNVEAAKLTYSLAQPALIKAKAYELCAKYVDPTADIATFKERYRQGRRLADDARFGARHLDFVNKKFTNDATTLVAILSVNNRLAEAKEVVLSAKTEWNDAAFHSALDKAIEGTVPAPWP